MKRFCFDIECNLFLRPEWGFANNPSEARVLARMCFEKRPCAFWCATVFDAATRESKDFTNCERLVDYLASAEEIISFNGRTYDLIALEELVGAEKMSEVWRKTHHDLRGWRMNNKLENAVRDLLPEISHSWEQVWSDRHKELSKSIDNDNIAPRLACSYRDAKFTLALFDRYQASGETERTFIDDWKFVLS